MSGANSTPVFKQRAHELGLGAELIDALDAAHINTFARLAYLTTYQPGQADDSALFDKLTEVVGRELADFERANIRQLFYESSAVSIAELKQRVERGDSADPVTIPLAERMHRMEAERNRMGGVHFSAHTEPPNKLVDLAFQMVSDQQLTWLPWQNLASRADELQLVKKDMHLVFDAQGSLKMSKKDVEAQSEVKGEIQIRAALRRRAMAFDLTGIISFQSHEVWQEKLFECLSKNLPSGYRSTSLEQCREADKLLWTRLSELTRGNLKVNPDGTSPVQVHFEALMVAPDVMMLLQPLPQTSRPGPYNGHENKDKKGKGKKGDKGKGKGSGSQMQLPNKCVAKNAEGKPICLNYNYGRCKRAAPGKRCDRGYHVCFHDKCFKQKPTSNPHMTDRSDNKEHYMRIQCATNEFELMLTVL